ncbi:hypothetical protein OS187_10490 [Xanthomonadaceae bacterium JHOS43]|nr:hypothetical protein [Xanthomonadaceae bacterium JHOS43]
MTSIGATHRVFRFIRHRVRAQWYLGPRFHLPLLLSGPLMLWLWNAWRSPWGWALCLVFILWCARGWWREAQSEQQFWESRRGLRVWLVDGRLHVSDGELETEVPDDLGDVRAIDAIVDRKGRVERLLVERGEGRKGLYLGFDDMDAFAREFRMHAPQARFRRVRVTWATTLREVP